MSMMTILLATAVACNAQRNLSGLASSEAELEAKLPEIFARAAAHYKALDAAATPLMKGSVEGKEFAESRTPHGYDRAKRKLDMRSVYWWTAGHYPGSLWYLYEATGDDFFRDRATAWTETLEPNAKVTDNHDIGFIMFCSYGNARRLLKTDRYDALLTETAKSLSKRFNGKLGLIRSWGAITNRQDFLVIPDNLMNLELLEFAGGRFDKIARSHADVTMRHHFDREGGCHHVLDYDQERLCVKGILRGQGASCETAWSRGQSWAIYGYTMMYRTTGLVRYLTFARKLAFYAMGHENMPEDGIPYWDYGAPGEERDSSAGAIMASALLELSHYVDAADRAQMRAFAVKQLLSLSSDAYFSQGDEIGHFLLKHGVGHKPSKSEIDTPLDYGDYYFLEALVRFRDLKAREAALATTKAKLPSVAKVPTDELARRCNITPDRAVEAAEALLTQPIPDTSDELYCEYWTTGNRTHYQRPYFERLSNLGKLVLAEISEDKGRFLPRINDYLRAICDMRSWVMPAHDWTDGARGNFEKSCHSVDLGSSDYAAHLACCVQLLGDRLAPQMVDRVKGCAESKVFAPLRRELLFHPKLGGTDAPGRRWHWWVDCDMNWSAVCWDNVVCAAMGLIDDADERAYFVDAALRSVPYYLSGFTPDGYCSEGMGYWNYGYGHHLQMGLLLRKLSDGKIDIFTTPIQRQIAAYPRAYTLVEGISPAFADGNGAADARFLEYVDSIWPDLPKDLPPTSEFPDGQVWLFRDPDGLSVAFKGGHNGEFHNHNDLGSYFVVSGKRAVAGDTGGEEYTRFTFSNKRYDSKMMNSYGHPVPVVGGKLQSTGRRFAAKVISKDLSSPKATVVLDLAGAYEVKSLRKLTRSFVYDRTAGTFTVTDHVEFSEPTSFESAFNTFLEGPNRRRRTWMKWNVRPEVVVKGGDCELIEEDVANPNRIAPHRVGVRLKAPVRIAEITFTYRQPPAP